MNLVPPNPRHPSESGMSPLKVTAVMGEPVAYYGDGLHLDGPLSWGAYVEYVREHGESSLPSISEPWAVDFALPLARWLCQPSQNDTLHPNLLDDDGRIWGWRCSAAQADWVAQGKHNIRKRPALEAMQRYTRAPVHNYGTGPMKAKDIPIPTRLGFEIVWFAVGLRDDLARLLGHVSHVAKLSRHGMGKVLAWRVEDMGEDWSVERDGLLTRRMPASYRTEGDGMAIEGAIRAPYHHRSRVVLAVGPEVGG